MGIERPSHTLPPHTYQIPQR